MKVRLSDHPATRIDLSNCVPQCFTCSPDNMPRPPSKRAKRAEASSDEERSSGESEEESFSASESDGDDEGEQSSEEVTTCLQLCLVPGIMFSTQGLCCSVCFAPLMLAA